MLLHDAATLLVREQGDGYFPGPTKRCPYSLDLAAAEVVVTEVQELELRAPFCHGNH